MGSFAHTFASLEPRQGIEKEHTGTRAPDSSRVNESAAAIVADGSPATFANFGSTSKTEAGPIPQEKESTDI